MSEYGQTIALLNRQMDRIMEDRAAALKRAEAAEAERDRYKRDVSEYEEREAACCPEDVGFEEVIASLRERAEKAEAEVARLKAVLAPVELKEDRDPRREVGAVVCGKHYENEYAVVKAGEVPDAQRLLRGSECGMTFPCGSADVFLRWMTPEECARHGIAYVPRDPVPVAAAPDLDALRAAYKQASDAWYSSDSGSDDEAVARVATDDAARALAAALKAKEVK